jgi:hypothetical protein
MQTLIQAVCTPGASLRDAILKDKKLADYDLVLSETRRVGRSRGWTKLHASSEDGYGAVNVQWLSSAATLLCRVVTKGGDPGPITGLLTSYLVSRHRRRILAIHIVSGR